MSSQVSTEQRIRNVAVVLAGGVGARMGLGVPKQLVEVAGRTILEHSVAAFDRHPAIDEVLVLMTTGHVEAARELVARAGFRKVSRVLEGGTTRNDTTRRALDAVGDQECNLLFHDAVRPLVTERIIADCVAALEHHLAVNVAIPSTDTILEVGADETVRQIPSRDRLRRAQTPQGFRASVIRAAYERAASDPGFAATDDCGVVLRYLPEVPIVVVPGDSRNIKVTEPMDLYLAERLLREAAL